MIGGSGAFLRVGLLIIGGLGLLVALIWFLGGSRISGGTLLESYFSESVQGLEVGAPVKYRGVTIGRVSDLGLVSAEYGQIRDTDREGLLFRLVFVRFAVDTAKVGRMPDTQAAVALGLRAKLASQGITGLSYLELDFVNPKSYPPLDLPWTPKAEYIPSMPSTFYQVQDAAQQMLARLNRVDIDALSSQLAGLLGDLRAQLSGGDLHDALSGAALLLRSTNAAVQAADLPGLSADLRHTSTSLRSVFEGEQMRKLLTNSALAAERLADVSARLPAVVASVQALTQRAGSSSADVERSLVPLLRDTQAAVQNLREMTESLRRYPAQIFSPPPPRSPASVR
jgi:phospholipid/cholesterol/gamma-HCH transport system substrate-binding protein